MVGLNIFKINICPTYPSPWSSNSDWCNARKTNRSRPRQRQHSVGFGRWLPDVFHIEIPALRVNPNSASCSRQAIWVSPVQRAATLDPFSSHSFALPLTALVSSRSNLNMVQGVDPIMQSGSSSEHGARWCSSLLKSPTLLKSIDDPAVIQHLAATAFALTGESTSVISTPKMAEAGMC